MERTLTPEEAEDVVAHLIEDFGLGALPRVRVARTDGGQWDIRWEQHHYVEAPMSAPAWRAWLEEHCCTLEPSRLETLEG